MAGIAGLLLVCAAPALALHNGIAGFSGREGATCTDGCHSGGTAPLARFEGPREVMADTVATFRLVVQSQSPKETMAGFDVAASDGLLAALPGQDEHLDADELTHDAPKPFAAGEAVWEFSWHVPNQPGTYTLYGSGLSANGNGGRGGDDAATATLTVRVIAEGTGDANCDLRVSAADVTAALLRLPFGTPGACNHADVNDDGVVTTADVAALTVALFELGSLR